VIYLASPYSDPDPFVREERYLRTMKALTKLLAIHQWAYSPIVHLHELAKIGWLSPGALFWQSYNFHMLSRSTKLAILELPGWERSKGIAAEKREAERLGLPIDYLALLEYT